MAGFFNGLLRKRAEASRIVYISFLVKQNLFERLLNWVNLYGAARLRNNFCQEKNYITLKKQPFYLLELNFERILHNTEYVLRCLKTVWNFSFSESRNFGSLCLLSRNSELQL